MLGKLAKHPNVIGVYDADLSIERLSAIDGATKGVMRDVTVTPVFSPVTRRMMRGAGGDSGLVSAEALGGGTAVAVAPKVAVKTRTKVVGFQVMGAGRATELLPLLQAGVSGAMPAMAACAPQATYEVYAAFKDGDAPLSAEKAERLREAEAVLLELGVAAVKYGCDLNGYYGGTPRLPRLALDGAERSRVEAALREVRN
jgi:dihydrodipicolinate synthase/N-acetylneuraminate lyase